MLCNKDRMTAHRRLLSGGGEAEGKIVATGTPQEIQADRHSITGKYL